MDDRQASGSEPRTFTGEGMPTRPGMPECAHQSLRAKREGETGIATPAPSGLLPDLRFTCPVHGWAKSFCAPGESAAEFSARCFGEMRDV
jgi:hypothetical protein